LESSGGRSRQAGKQAFFQVATDRSTESTRRLTAPTSPYVLQAGSIIPAALITGIRSDLPGQVTAQVTENVYDSPTGRILLVPQGSRLIGTYDSAVSAGQNRVLLAWDRMILPGGQSILMNRMPGADAAGMAGLQDRTNYHWGNLLKATAVSTFLGIGTELATDGGGQLVQALRYGTQDTVNQTGRNLVQREIDVPPTLTIRPGFPLRVIITRDLLLEPQGLKP
jgi:type IV secretion system protein VirB10